MQNLNKKKQNYTSHIQPHTSQKGITLIALIITVIVMLILVGVTINVALNGGLFDKADTATRQTEEKAILEEMLAMMVIEDNGKFNPDTIIANMRNKHPEYQIDDSNKPNIIITGKLGTYKYIVSETEIKIGESKTDYTTDLEKYFFNDDGTGKEGLLVETEGDTDPITCIDDANTIPKASEDLLFMSFGERYMIVEYNGADYKIPTTDSNVPQDGAKIVKLPNEVYPAEMTAEEIKIKQYITGYSGTGRYLFNLVDAENMTFKGNHILPDAASLITIENVDGNSKIITIKYNETTKYNILVNENDIAVDVSKVIEVPREYPVAYSANGNVLIIEISENEAVHRMLGEVCRIEEIDDINKIAGHEKDTVINEIGKSYSRVMVSKNDLIPAVYCKDNDRWYLVTGSGSTSRTQTINNKMTSTLDTTTSKEELQQMIQEAE